MSITTDRGRVRALANLVAWQTTGGYKLPAEVRKAVSVHEAVRALVLPDPPAVRHVETAAAAMVDALERSDPADPMRFATDLAAAQAQAQRITDATRLVSLAAEQAGMRAVIVASDAATRIIVEHLRPAFDDVIGQATKLVTSGMSVDSLTGNGWDAPPRVRTARVSLSALADRLRALRQARSTCVGLSGSEPQHDDAGRFALLAEPQKLVPGWSLHQPLPQPDIPADPPAALLWLVTEGLPARPWLPTPAEQDDAWLAVYGEQMQQRREAHQAVRAYSGLPS